MSDIVEVMARAITLSETGYGDGRARAALSALEQAGYAVVPVEPTEIQKQIARQHFGMNPFLKDGAPMDRLWLRCWAAMLTAYKQEGADETGEHSR